MSSEKEEYIRDAERIDSRNEGEEEQLPSSSTLKVLSEAIQRKERVLETLRLSLQLLNFKSSRSKSHSPLYYSDIEKKTIDVQRRIQQVELLLSALHKETDAYLLLQKATPAERSHAEFVYGNAALETSKARRRLFTGEEEARLLVFKQWKENGSPPLQVYLDVCDLYRRTSPDSTRSLRQDLGRFLVSEKINIPHLELFTCTWNVGNEAPFPSDMENLIPLQDANHLFDVVVVGLQECKFDLTVEMLHKAGEFYQRAKFDREGNYFPLDDQEDEVLDLKVKMENMSRKMITSKAGQYFASLVQDHLGVEDYYLVRKCEFQEMRIFVFALREHAKRITRVEYASQSCGVANLAGNKGGVAVSLRFQNSRICFLSCHLAAHRIYVNQRNSDCKQILSMMTKKLNTWSVGYLSDWDHVFLMGDLNYRLDVIPVEHESIEGEISFVKHNEDHTAAEREHVMSLIEARDWTTLIESDQLRTQQQAQHVLMGFQEAEVYPFAPTFKISNRFTKDINQRYNAKRLPAYCDRILWHSTPSLNGSSFTGGEWISQVELFSNEMSTSDHNPVSSRFLIKMDGQQQQSSDLKTLRFPLFGSSMSSFGIHKLHAKQGMQLAVWNLEATHLLPQDSFTQKADPYVVLYSPELFPLRGKRGNCPHLALSRTSVQFRTLNCSWANTTLAFRCPEEYSSAESLRGKHVTLAVRDFDFTKFDDSMGEVVLSLDYLVEAFQRNVPLVIEENFLLPNPVEEVHPARDNVKPKTVHFILPINLNGQIAGTLSGYACIYSPAENVQATRMQKNKYWWKFYALWEYFLRRRQLGGKADFNHGSFTPRHSKT